MLVRIVVARNSTVQRPNGRPLSRPYTTMTPDTIPIRLMMTWITSNASFEANVMTASRHWMFPASPLYRLFAKDGDTPQQAPFAGGKIRARMQRAAIVPHQYVAGAPDMLVDEFFLLLMTEQLLQDRIALRPRQALDFARHQAVDIERLATRCRMRAHHEIGRAHV